MKERILLYLQKHYARTGWPNVKLVDLTNHVGGYDREVLNKLYEEKKISVHPGINSTIITYIP